MYTSKDCTDEEIFTTNIESRYLIIKEEFLAKAYRDEEHQLVKAVGGFGCNPKATLGNAIYVEEQTNNDPEKYRVDRCDDPFIGIAKDSTVKNHKDKYMK